MPKIATYDIEPMGAPRMTRASSFSRSKVILRYYAFKKRCQLAKIKIENGDLVIFTLAMPESWSKKKKRLMDGQPHQSKPDIDNMCKALMDALFTDDAHIWDIHIQKFWGQKGQIKIIGNHAK